VEDRADPVLERRADPLKSREPRSPTSQPVDRHGLDAALRLFVAGFVIEDKRTQMHKRLLAAERRLETLVALPRWLAGTPTELEGSDRSPAGIRARLGELVGVHLDAAGARRTTIAHALDLGRAKPSLFIGDAGSVAMITVEAGPPLLCARW
jgi:hypothetical protein